MKNFFKHYGLFLAWLLATFACIASLYLSAILHWPVCNLCWYQRIAIYPLVLMLGIAAFRNEKCIIPYAKPFCIIGVLFALYQYAEQMIPGFSPIDFCMQDISCATTHIKWLGFITLPLLSAVVCVVIYFLLTLSEAKRE